MGESEVLEGLGRMLESRSWVFTQWFPDPCWGPIGQRGSCMREASLFYYVFS